MSVRAGSIVMVGGRNVVDRLQRAGLGNAQVPIETIREIGNDLVVDKVPGEADFTFSFESWDVTTDMMAFLSGKMGTQPVADPPGAGDAAGTEYRWEDTGFVNVISPWKINTGAQGGNIGGGLVIPNYYPTRLRYRFGVTDNAVQEVELAGASYYYAQAAPVEEIATSDGAALDFVTSEAARAHRLGGRAGTTFKYIMGVMVNGVPQIEGTDYTIGAAPADGASGPVTIRFIVPPPNGAVVRYTYFSEVGKTYPQAVNADATVKPGAVRGRNIVVLIGTRPNQIRFGAVQTFELEATKDTEVDREMGNPDATGRSVNGIDTTGTVTIRPPDVPHFFAALSQATGVATDEVFGYFNQDITPVEIQIQNPKNPGQILKTVYIPDGQFQPPPMDARVNTSTDFAMAFNSASGTFREYKGARP